jgi:hypothetical protein
LSSDSDVIYFGRLPIEKRFLTEAWFDLRAEVVRKGSRMHRHLNPDGTLGGWVADTAKFGENVTVEPGGLVWVDAEVPSGAIVGKDQVFGRLHL